MFTATRPTPARWINTGGDVRIHLVPAGTPVLEADDVDADGFYPTDVFQTRPVCDRGAFHGSWLYAPVADAPLKRCETCFAEYRTPDGTLPPLQHPGGLHGGYRLFTAEDLPWADRAKVLPRAEEGRGIVVIRGWGSSQSIPAGFEGELKDKVRLNLYKFHGVEEGFERHELDGTVYDTQLEATRAAYEAGCTAFMVYEDERIGAQR